jgi:hypothetical protein
MRFKYCVAMMLFVAVIGVVVLAMPATAASHDAGASKVGDGGYVVKFLKAPASGGFSTLSVSSISQGEYKWHPRLINYYTEYVLIDLNWGNPSNSLRLRVFTPDGYVLGPAYDSSDGSINGRIYMQISRSGGVAQGTWYAEVYGYQVAGVQSYSI